MRKVKQNSLNKMATQTKYNGNTESEHGIMGEKESKFNTSKI